MTDPIADMLTRIRNSSRLRKEEVVLPYSNIKWQIAKILEQEGYLKKAEKIQNHFSQIKLLLKYNDDKESVIRSVKRISKPGRRVYVHHQKLPYVLENLGIAIISTSQGLMTNKEARKKKMGGEIICEIY